MSEPPRFPDDVMRFPVKCIMGLTKVTNEVMVLMLVVLLETSIRYSLAVVFQHYILLYRNAALHFKASSKSSKVLRGLPRNRLSSATLNFSDKNACFRQEKLH